MSPAIREDENASEAKGSVWTALHLRPRAFRDFPEGLRAWVTIASAVALAGLVICVLITVFLLCRLGWDALSSPAPNYQEATKNFLFAFASAFGAPFLVWRTWVAHKQASAAAEQAHIALENHITGIFSKSVELMGQVREVKTNGPGGVLMVRSVPNIEARLGALYSLERLLRESEKDQRAILETLCAYVRENSPVELPQNEEQASLFRRGDLPPTATRRGDVQAALTIVGRRSDQVRSRAKVELWRLDFRNSNLISYDFSGLNFNRADFSNSFLNAADMTGASFDDCIFTHTFLRAALMKNASFRTSIFKDSDLEKAEIDKTNFGGAKFIATDLREAQVTNIALEGANLDEAFGFSLQYAVESAKRGEPSYHYAKELLGALHLVQHATYDKNTSVSQVFREAVDLLTQQQKASSGDEILPSKAVGAD